MSDAAPRPRGFSTSNNNGSSKSAPNAPTLSGSMQRPSSGHVIATSPRHGPTASPPTGPLRTRPVSAALHGHSSPTSDAPPPVSPRTKAAMPPQPPTPNATGAAVPLNNNSFALFPPTLGPLTGPPGAATDAQGRVRRASFGALEASVYDSPSSPKQVPRKPSNSRMTTTASARDSPRHGSIGRGASETPHLFYADHRMTYAKIEQGDSYLIPEGMGRMQVGCSWEHISKRLVDVDASALLFSSDGRKVDHVSFGRRSSNDKSVIHTGDEKGHDRAGDDEAIRINFSMVNETVSYIAIVLNVYTTGRTLDDVDNVSCRLLDIDSSSKFVPAFSPNAHSYNLHRVPHPQQSSENTHSHFQRRRSSASAVEMPGSTELSPAGSIHLYPKPTLPPPTMVPPSGAHEAMRYTYRNDSRKMTGVVMLIFERLTATEKGRAQREKIANMLTKLATVKAEAAAIRRELDAQNTTTANRSTGAPPAAAAPIGQALSPLPPPLACDTPTLEDAAHHRTSSAGTSHSAGGGASVGVDEEGDETAFILPGWRVIAAGIPVAGKTHRHVTAEVSDLIARFSVGRPEDAFLPPEEACGLHGFRSRVFASAGEFDAELSKRREMMDLHRTNMTGGGPDLTQVGSLLDDLTFVEQYARELQRRRLAARGKSQRHLETESQCSTRTPTPDAERIINNQFKYQRGQRSTRPRLVRQAVRLYSVGRGMKNFTKAYFMDSDSSDEDTYLGDIFPNYRSRDAVRYGTKCYNIGCRRDDLYQYYLDHKASYAAAAREAVAREAAAQEAAWASFSFSLENFDDDERDDFDALSGDSSPGAGGGGDITSGNEASGTDGGEDPESGNSPLRVVVRKPAKPLMPPKPTYATVVAPRIAAANEAAKAAEEAERQEKEAAAKKLKRGSVAGGRRDSRAAAGRRASPPRQPGGTSGGRKPSPLSKRGSPLQSLRRIEIDELSLSDGEDAAAGPAAAQRRRSLALSIRRSSIAPAALTELPTADDDPSAPQGQRRSPHKFTKTWNYGNSHRFVRPAATQRPRPITEVLSSPEFQHPERRQARSPRLSLFDEEVRAWVAAYLARERDRKQVYRRRSNKRGKDGAARGPSPTSPTLSPPQSDAKRLRLKSLFADLPPLSDVWTGATPPAQADNHHNTSGEGQAPPLSPTDTNSPSAPAVGFVPHDDDAARQQQRSMGSVDAATLVIPPSGSMTLSQTLQTRLSPKAVRLSPKAAAAPPPPRRPVPPPNSATTPRGNPAAAGGRAHQAGTSTAPAPPPAPPPPPPPLIFEDPELNRLAQQNMASNRPPEPSPQHPQHRGAPPLSPRSSTNETFATPHTKAAGVEAVTQNRTALPPRRNVASAPAKRVLPSGPPPPAPPPLPHADHGTTTSPRQRSVTTIAAGKSETATPSQPVVTDLVGSRPFSAAVSSRSNPLLAPVRPSSGARRGTPKYPAAL